MIIEPLLSWNKDLDRWEYIDAMQSIWMSDATLKAYVDSWFTLHNFVQPTNKQKDDGFAYCRRIKYYQYICDQAIHHTVSLRPFSSSLPPLPLFGRDGG